MSSSAKEYLIQEIRKTCKENNYTFDEMDKVEEGLYVPVKKEQWEKVEKKLEDIEEKHGFDLRDEKKFLNEMRNPDKLEGVEDQEVEKDIDKREELLIRREAQNNESNEVIARTDQQIGIKNIFNLQQDIYNDTKNKMFIISKQKEWEGRISVELSETKKKFELMAVYENKDGAKKFKHFGQNNPNKGWKKVDDFNQSFYQYKFVANDQEYLVLSTEKLNTSRCKLYGTHVSINDYKTVGENRKLPVNQDIIFVHSVEPAIEPFNNQQLHDMQEFVDREYFMEHVFGVYRHPDWFEDFILNILSVGEDFDGYPPHFLWLAPPDTGKSTFLESSLRAFDEPQKEPFEGGGSTIKGLTPSFKQNPPKEGMLLKSQRIAAVDEKLNLLKNTVESNNQATQDAFRPMTSLLEHKSRKFESGNGSISGKMEAQMIAATNDAYGISNLIEAQEKLDIPYLSRFIQYEQLDSHVKYIDEQKNSIDCEYEEGLPERNDEFISLMDTLRDIIRVDVESSKIGAMHEDLMQKVPAGFQQTFRARHKHHLKCTVAGVAKIRFFTENRDSFEAKQKDYERCKELWEILIQSWGETDASKFSEQAKLQAITHAQRQVFEVVDDNPGIEPSKLAEKTDVERMSWILSDLKKKQLIAPVETEEEGKKYYPYWCDEAEFEEVEEETLY